ncbi:hypothetical protein GA0115240_16802 [Streptomyces sp. DvalAA-14]|uniref:hypothetical protein n=1 Tax=unclassified Streptomyces TaxID=2593676 RepID=UPI00081B15B7|nr:MULTISPECIES: hypothetical protein [unclassified Streptomyces]MYS24720.1 hypothetical protein [Streptomyces sp. SID4948]SCE48787.1 hypothetical protein GA0115240_16802 [Streptomyces sp. DvalAA-14]
MTVDTAVPAISIDDVDLETKRSWMLEALMDIYTYARTPGFQAVLAEMNELPTLQDKDRFVRTVLLAPAELERRGITPPEGVVVQRSRFMDDRPTVFCVVKYLPDPTRKMTLTFDQGKMLWPTQF